MSAAPNGVPNGAPGADGYGESQAVIGFTEAELGLVLAVLFLVLWVVSQKELGTLKSTTTAPKPPPTVPADSANRLLGRHEADSVALTHARDSLRLALDSLRSRDLPACNDSRVRLAEGPLFTVLALGSDAFVVGSDTLTWDRLQSRYAEPIAQATGRCRHIVRVVREDVAGRKVFDGDGLSRLRTKFRTDLVQ